MCTVRTFAALITFCTAFFIYLGSCEKTSRKQSLYSASSSHILRHSAKRHMLAQDGDSANENITIANAEDDAAVQSNSFVVPQFSVSIKVESNHSTAMGLGTEGNLPDHCHTNGPCESLSATCMQCDFNYTCVYGDDVNVTCHIKDDTKCHGNRTFIQTFNCRYCYQTTSKEHSCQRNTSCHVISAPRQRYIAKCIVKPHVLCLGKRVFVKNILCNWTKGYSWSTALLLSIVLGGFGVDRFYLGMWQEGIGKLFSFGGLGVWTLVDVILIAAGYLGPADGSLYIRN